MSKYCSIYKLRAGFVPSVLGTGGIYQAAVLAFKYPVSALKCFKNECKFKWSFLPFHPDSTCICLLFDKANF